MINWRPSRPSIRVISVASFLDLKTTSPLPSTNKTVRGPKLEIIVREFRRYLAHRPPMSESIPELQLPEMAALSNANLREEEAVCIVCGQACLWRNQDLAPKDRPCKYAHSILTELVKRPLNQPLFFDKDKDFVLVKKEDEKPSEGKVSEDSIQSLWEREMVSDTVDISSSPRDVAVGMNAVWIAIRWRAEKEYLPRGPETQQQQVPQQAGSPQDLLMKSKIAVAIANEWKGYDLSVEIAKIMAEYMAAGSTKATSGVATNKGVRGGLLLTLS